MKRYIFRFFFITFAALAGLAGMSSCSLFDQREATLSLTDEEFVEVVQGQWKVVKAGTSHGWDENEETHIYDDSLLDDQLVDYVVIAGNTVTMYFLHPVKVLAQNTSDGSEYWDTPKSDLTLTLKPVGQGCSTKYFLGRDLATGEIDMNYYVDMEIIDDNIRIEAYGKKDFVADRLIFNFHNSELLFEMEKD